MRQSEGTGANASFYYFFWRRRRYNGTAGLIPAAVRTVPDVQWYDNTGTHIKNETHNTSLVELKIFRA
jgi:hypothetical protein